MWRTWAEIHLGNLRHNVRQVRRRAGSGVKVLVTVKADAYGHGYDRISKVLVEEGVDYLGVANVIEALQVMQCQDNGGKSIPIMTLGPNLPDEMDVVIENDLVPIVCSEQEAELYSAKAAAAGKELPVHVKIDTGMGRIGIWKEGCVKAVRRICAMENLLVEGIASHFPSADEEDLSFSEQQIEEFNRILSELESMGISIPLRHMANSGALLNLDRSRFNMVRPGLVIYGEYPSSHARNPIDVKPVLSWKTRVVFLKDAEPGRTISYGRTFTTETPMRIATLSIGYGDGFNRGLSNTGRVLVRGRYAPILGTVTMDQVMVDVTDIPDVKVGDEVVLMGTQGRNSIRASDIAGTLGTIPYVVLCGISKRVVRKYIESS
jgi:alanine racemase